MENTEALLDDDVRSGDEDRDITCHRGHSESIDAALGPTAQGTNCCCYFPHRYRLFVLIFTGLVLFYCTRVNFNVALVAMVNFTVTQQTINSSDRCPGVLPQNTSTTDNEGGFAWTPSEQSFLLSSFYYGYIVLQLPGGYLAERYSGKLLMGLGIVVPGILNLLMPLMAGYGVAAFGAMRILCGLVSAPVCNAIMVLWAHWAPKYERTWLVGTSLVGMSVGNIVGFPISGILCNSGFIGGWPSVFYVFGGLCCLWGVFWFLLITDSPRDDPTISQKEKELITENTDSISSKKYNQPPIVAILTSPAVWAYWVVAIVDSFASYIFSTDLGLYFSQVLGYDIKKNGIISSLPFICNFVANITMCPLADCIRSRGILSTKAVRKICTLIGELGLAVCLLLIGMLVECEPTSAVVLLMVGQFLNAFSSAGFASNPLDIAPMYSGTIVAIGNTLGNTMGFITPITVELLTGDSPSRSRWRVVFYVTSAILALGGILYALFAEGELLPWAQGTRESGEEDPLTDGSTYSNVQPLLDDTPDSCET